MVDAEVELQSFLDKYNPEIAALGAACVKKLRKLYPTATVWVYDNYNALAVAFGPPAEPAHAIFSIALYPRWISLFFLQAKTLEDPSRLLQGTGDAIRHIVLHSPRDLDQPAIQFLLKLALKQAKTPLPAKGKGELIIQSVSAKQRPRRPVVRS
jgi:hypothetical protein